MPRYRCPIDGCDSELTFVGPCVGYPTYDLWICSNKHDIALYKFPAIARQSDVCILKGNRLEDTLKTRVDIALE